MSVCARSLVNSDITLITRVIPAVVAGFVLQGCIVLVCTIKKNKKI